MLFRLAGLLFLIPLLSAAAPLRVAVVGLVHGHVSGFFSRNLQRQDVQLVGIVEPDQTLVQKYTQKFHIDPKIAYRTIDEMLTAAKPEAVLAYTNTFDHKMVVEACAKRGVHVMMEKPLAVSNEHARAIQQAAERGHIHVLVNYETTWYRSNAAAYSLAQSGALGGLRKAVIHDGHRGPKEIGTPPEFNGWLGDPEKNGAGALFDFGCYGADLMTWIMNGTRPLTVTAVLQTMKPDMYPKVDDEATVILAYPKTQAIIQASWNWPFDRKDMELYGSTGEVFTVKQNDILVRAEGDAAMQERPAPALAKPMDDSLNYLTAIVRGEIKDEGLSSLPVNIIVTEILVAARESARTGRAVSLASAR